MEIPDVESTTEMTTEYVHESTSPPVPALQNKYATSASMEAALKDDVVGDNDVPHWERPFLPTEKQDRGRLRIRVNKTLEMRKAMNAENKRSMDRKILSTPRKQYTPREHRYEDLQDQENDQHHRGLAFCISPPGGELTQGHEGPEQCSMDDWGERQQRDIKSLERNDDNTYMDVGQRACPKKPAKRKPLVVRNTRTQNIRKQVAHDIMHPKDPAWLVRRKNLQAKIAIANEFKAKAVKKARANPGNVWTEQCTDIETERYTDIETERSIDIVTAEESDLQTDRSVAINFTDDEMASNISNGNDQEENFYKREMDEGEPDYDDGSSSVQCAWTIDDKCLQSQMPEGDRPADVPHAAAMTFCISPPAKGPRNSVKNVPPSLSLNDKENEDVNPNTDMNDFDDQDDYKDYKEVRQTAVEDTGSIDNGPVKKTGKRKPLVVRTTRTQNIRKQVAQQIMYPEDPPWMKRRKNMQAKVAMAQAFKTKAMKKPPTNSNYVHGGYHEDLSPRLGPRTDSQRQPYRGEYGIGGPNHNMEYDGQNEDVEDVVYLDQISENRRTPGSFSVLPPIQAFGETVGHHDDEDFDKEEEMTDVGSALNTDRTLPEDSGEYMGINSNRVPGGNVGKEEHSLNEVIDDTCFENNDGPNNILQKEDLVGQTKGPKSSEPRIPKKKPLIVRSTRTQNIRKKVAQEIMNPEDPPWVKKRKNLQEKIAMTNAFKAQSEQGKGRIGNGHLKPPLRPQLNNQHQPPRSSVPADVDFLDDQYGSEMNYEKGSVLLEENGQNNIAFTISPPPFRRLPPIPRKGDEKQPPQYAIKKLPPVCKPNQNPSQKKLVIRTTRAQEIKKKALQLQAEEPGTPRSDEMQENFQQHEKSPQVLPAYVAKTEPSKADDVQRVSRLKMLRNDMKSKNAILPSLSLQISTGSASPCYSPEKSILGAMFTSPTPRVNSLDGKLYVPDSSNGKMYQKDASRGFTDEKGVSDSYETERQKLDNSLRNHWKNLIEGNLKDIINLKRQLIISREKERFAEGVFETLKLKMAIEKHAMYAQQGKGDGSFALEEKCLRYRPSNDDLRQRLTHLRAQSSSIVEKILTHKYVEVGNVPTMRTKRMIGDCFPRKGVLDLKEQYNRYRYIYSRKHSRRSLEPTFITYGRERGRSHFAVVLIEENLYSSRKSGFIQVFRRIKEEIVEEEKTVAKQSKMTHGTERKSAIQMKSSANKASKARTLTQRKGMNKEVSKSQTSSKGTDKRATCGARVPKAATRKPATRKPATRKPASTSQKQSKPVATPNKMAAKNAKNGNSPKKGNVKKRDVPKALNQTKTKKISADIESGSKDEEIKVDVGVMVNTLPAAFTEAARSNDSRDSNIYTKRDNSNKNVSKKSNGRARSSLIKSTRIPAPTYNMRQASARRCSFDDPEEDGPWTRPTRIPAPTQSLMYSNPRRYHSIEEL